MDLEKLEKIMDLMVRYKITDIEIEGVKIAKPVFSDVHFHENEHSEEQDEEVLFWSADSGSK